MTFFLNFIGMKLNEVVTAFTVGHWSASRTVESYYISYRSSPSNLIESATTKLGDEYFTAFYDHLIKFFSKDGDTVMEFGSGTKAGKYHYFLLRLSQTALCSILEISLKLIPQKNSDII